MRYGHLNFQSLKSLATKEMNTELPVISILNKVCEGCLIGKQPRANFKAHMHMISKDLLRVAYLDVCGPFEVLSQVKIAISFHS